MNDGLGVNRESCVLLEHNREFKGVVLSVILGILHYVEGRLLFVIPLVDTVALSLTAHSGNDGDMICTDPRHGRGAVVHADVDVEVEITLGGSVIYYSLQLLYLSVYYSLPRRSGCESLFRLGKRGGVACHINGIKDRRIKLISRFYKLEELCTVREGELSRGGGYLKERCGGSRYRVLEGEAYLLSLRKSEIKLAVGLTAHTGERYSAVDSVPHAVGINLDIGIITSAYGFAPA